MFCQSTAPADQPLGDVAKRNGEAKKENTGSAKAKRVFSDEDMSLRKNPIPTIALQGVENTQEILTAIHEYRAKNGAEATEKIVHEWFDEQSETLADAIDANLRMQQHNRMKWESQQDQSPYRNRDSDYDYHKANERRLSEAWSQRADGRSTQENFEVISRIQQVLAKVRFDVIRHPYQTQPTAYDWFKIRTAEGRGTY
jgi:hypothetical protein